MVYQANSGALRRVLYANAGFSAICGAVLATAAEPVAGALLSGAAVFDSFAAATLLTALGVGLAGFAVLVVVAASRATVDRRAVIAIILSDLAWVVASVWLLACAPTAFTPLGEGAITGVGALVFAFAGAQAVGLAALYEGRSRILIARSGRDVYMVASREINAPADIAWAVMADHEGYADVADNLARVEILEGDGLGAIRKCRGVGGETWTERANLWEEGVRYGFVVDAGAADYPYPLERLSAVWEARALGPARSVVSMQFDISAKASLKGAIFVQTSLVMFPRVLDRLLNGWGQKMERVATEDAGLGDAGPGDAGPGDAGAAPRSDRPSGSRMAVASR